MFIPNKFATINPKFSQFIFDAVTFSLTLILMVIYSDTISNSASAQDALYHPRPASRLHWHSCDHGSPGTECAILQVPLNYQHPDQGTIRISVARYPVARPAQRIGTLFVNPGGPGGTGEAMLKMFGAGFSFRIRHSKNSQEKAALQDFYNSYLKDIKELHEHFDIIGFDPRGTGRGDLLHCPRPIVDRALPFVPETLSEYNQLRVYNHQTGVACAKASGRLINHVDTRSVLEDIDSLRRALNEKTISYYGASYGTVIGQLYAERYPTHLRAMVLDGNIDHAESGWLQIQRESQSEEAELLYLAKACRIDFKCTIPHKDLVGDFAQLISEAQHGMLKTSHAQIITATDVTKFFYGDLLDYAPVLESSESLFDKDSDVLDSMLDPDPVAYNVVSCHDFIRHPLTFAELQDWIKRARVIAPHMYRYSEFLAMNLGCINWPIPAQDPPAPIHITSKLPVLLLANRIDPATPLAGSIDLHHDMPGSRLIIDNAVGHTSIGNSHCGRIAFTHYLLTAQLPQQDERCSDKLW